MRAALVLFALILSVGIFTACGGSSGATFGGPPSAVTPCPGGFTGTAPNCISVQANNSFTPLSTATTAPLPSIAGYSGTILVPPAAIAAPITISTSADAPSGITPLLRNRRAAAAIARTPLQGGVAALLYITLTASGPVTFTGFPGFTIQLPSNLLNEGPFYLSQLINGVWTTVGGPVDQSNGSVTFSMLATGSLTIPSGSSVYFALYNGGTAPTPTPGVTASPAPTTSSSGAPTPTPPSSPTQSATPSSTPSPVGSSTVAPTPTGTATVTPTIAPTATPGTPTPTPTPFPTASPTVTPSPPPGGQTVASFTVSGIPSGTYGSTTSGFVNLKMFTSSGAQITGTVSNQVTVTSSNSAVKLSVNNGPSSTSATLTSGSDLLSLSYTGLAINPVTLTVSASSATTLTATFTPTALGVSYSGPLVSSSPEIDLYAPTGTGSTFSFTAAQPGWTGTYGQSLVTTIPNACNSFAAIATPAPAATNFTVTAIASPVPGTCTVGIAGFGSSVNVTITYTTFGVTLH